MRVLFVTAHYPPDFVSGATLQVQRLAEHTAAAGHEVAVFAGTIAAGLPDGATSRQRLGGVDVHWIGSSGWIEQDDDRNWQNPDAASALAALLDEFAPDVVHAHTLQTLGAAGVDAAIDRGIRVVLTMHDLWWWCSRLFLVDREMRPCPLVADAGECPCARTPEWRTARATELASTLARIDEILVPSAIMGDLVAANGVDRARISVDENDVEITVVPGNPDQRHTSGDVQFVYVGGDHPVKGVDVVLDAARAMRRTAGWRLATYGVGARRLPRGLPVSFAEPYDPSAAAEVLAAADVLVIPSIARESFSIAAREALLAGAAVITSDCLGPEEVVRHGENGFVVPTGDVQALAGVMRRLVDDRALLASLRDGDRRSAPPLRTPGRHAADLLTRYASPPPHRRARPGQVVLVTDGEPTESSLRILAALDHHGIDTGTVIVNPGDEDLTAQLSADTAVIIGRTLPAERAQAVRVTAEHRGLTVVSERSIGDGLTAAEIRAAAATAREQRTSRWRRTGGSATVVAALVGGSDAWSMIETAVRATIAHHGRTTLTVVDMHELDALRACDVALVVGGADGRAWMLASLAGAASIVSADLAGIVVDGRSAMVAETPAEWGVRLARLLDDPIERAVMASAAHRQVMLHHGPHSLADRVLDALDRHRGR
jgi:glycosyltransferase involved in cell wall biosynthesis